MNGLFGLVTVHCIWYPKCAHIEVACDPVTAHAQMETHYTSKHSQILDTLTGTRS